MKVGFHILEEDRVKDLIYVVMVVRYKDKWLVVRHKERTTWEIPGGHIEVDETPDEAAARELVEETGAVIYSVKAMCDYSVTREEQPSYGRLYYCEVIELGPLGDTEIAEVMEVDELPENLTYKAIQPYLFQEVKGRKGL